MFFLYFTRLVDNKKTISFIKIDIKMGLLKVQHVNFLQNFKL